MQEGKGNKRSKTFECGTTGDLPKWVHSPCSSLLLLELLLGFTKRQRSRELREHCGRPLERREDARALFSLLLGELLRLPLALERLLPCDLLLVQLLLLLGFELVLIYYQCDQILRRLGLVCTIA